MIHSLHRLQQSRQPGVRPELVVQLVVLVQRLLLVALQALLQDVDPAGLEKGAWRKCEELWEEEHA